MNHGLNASSDTLSTASNESINLQGVNLNGSKLPKLLQMKVDGVHLDVTRNRISFIKRKNSSRPSEIGIDGISVEDLCIALKIYYDSSIKHKNISFSLEPWDDHNPSGPVSYTHLTLPTIYSV
eukprot:TRINITY_DN24813_c0_g1_i1.p1 TRINITY_DN24813_c0_g1~~TRINITY_DN24813_c0_g1_i1.p1  ORF type:complete len:123 (+),score=5.44 TRINITY_DN24813_c0_g1_i1:226-594(+)